MGSIISQAFNMSAIAMKLMNSEAIKCIEVHNEKMAQFSHETDLAVVIEELGRFFNDLASITRRMLSFEVEYCNEHATESIESMKLRLEEETSAFETSANFAKNGPRNRLNSVKFVLSQGLEAMPDSIMQKWSWFTDVEFVYVKTPRSAILEHIIAPISAVHESV